MKFLEVLRAARSTPTAVLHHFRIQYSQKRSAFFAFVEGVEDKEYLQPELQRRYRDNFQVIVCGNKQAVLKALRDVDDLFPEAMRTMFFVDKDLDDFVGVTCSSSHRLYVSTFHSIENDIARLDSLRYVLCEIVHMGNDDARLAGILDQYEHLQLQLALKLRRFTACAICGLRHGHSVNLNGVNLNRLFQLNESFELIVQSDIVEEIERMSGVAVGSIPLTEIKAQIRQLDIKDSDKWLRGKAALWLFAKFLDRLYSELRKSQANGNRLRLQTPVTESNAFQLLSGRIQYPETLSRFLDQMSA